MEIKLESNGVCLTLSTVDKEKNIEFKTLVKAYEIVTGDELEITENNTEKIATLLLRIVLMIIKAIMIVCLNIISLSKLI